MSTSKAVTWRRVRPAKWRPIATRVAMLASSGLAFVPTVAAQTAPGRTAAAGQRCMSEEI